MTRAPSPRFCDNLPGSLREIVYPLANVVNGMSTTTIDASLDSLQTGDFAINVHKSETELGVYVSCGNIPAAAAAVPTVGGPPSAGGGVSLQVYLLIAAGALALAGGTGLVLRTRQQR